MITLHNRQPTQNSQLIFKRKKFLEIIGMLLAILIAAILGNYIALIATQQIVNDWTRFIVGIFIGLLVGILVGIYFKRGWSKLLYRMQQ